MKKILSLLVAVSLLLSMSVFTFPAAAEVTFSGGTGIEGDPYIITTEEQFEAISTTEAIFYKLGNDIEFETHTTITAFAGTFDGNGKTLTVTGGTAPIFTASSGAIKNLNVDGKFDFKTRYSGAVVGTNSGSVLNCVNFATITGSVSDIGGVVGSNSGTVRNCANEGTMTMTSSGLEGIGGVVGRTTKSVYGCYNKGNISKGKHVGGIIGTVGNTLTVADCFNIGDITSSGTATVGGIIGEFADNNNTRKLTLKTCYNTGTISDGTNNYSAEKAIMGREYEENITVITSCYYLTAEGTQKDGTVALTEEQMKLQSSFEGFDFYDATDNTDGVWIMPDKYNAYKYPIIKGNEYIDAIDFGTEANPHEITTAEEFSTLMAVNATNAEVYYKLMNDIELTGSYTVASFAGNFNGNGCTIKVTDGTEPIFTASSGKIEKLTIDGNFVFSVAGKGGLVGTNTGTIANCLNKSNITATKSTIGGLIGTNKGTVSFCGNEGNISIAGFNEAGGIIGKESKNHGVITGCYNIGNISGREKIGGIVGATGERNHTIINCFNKGNITASNANPGGILGFFAAGTNYDRNLNIKYSYSAGNIKKGTTNVSAANAIVGNTNEQELARINLGEKEAVEGTDPVEYNYTSYCYYLTADGTGLEGTKALSNDQMKTASSFIGFDFYDETEKPEGVWIMPSSDNAYKYPIIKDNEYFEAIIYGKSEEYPYEIATADDFINKIKNAEATEGVYFKITAPITLNGEYMVESFAGDLNGNGQTITITNGATPLFKDITSTAKVYNLNLAGNVIITTGNASVLSRTNAGTISGCDNRATLTHNTEDSKAFSGVFTGNNTGIIKNCVNYAEVNFQKTNSGGIAGWNQGIIDSCGNEGNITNSAGSSNTGGIAGLNQKGTETVKNCYNTGTIVGGTLVGGIIGNLLSANSKITNCYNAGNIVLNNSVAGKYAGGIVGGIGTADKAYANISLTNCYNSGAIMLLNTNKTADWAIYGIIFNDTETVPTISNAYYLAAENTDPGSIQGLVSNEFAAKVEEFDISLCTIEDIAAPTLYETYADGINVFSTDKISLENKFKLLNKDVIISFANANFGKMGWALTDVGFVVTKKDADPADAGKSKSIGKINYLGDFAAIAYGDYITEGGYVIKPYATYTRVGEDAQTIYGNEMDIISYKVNP